MVARVLVVCAAVVACAFARPELHAQNVSVHMQTDAGWVRGLARWTDDGVQYASFRGVPYAKQPLGELRFKELEPSEPWEDMLDATEEGPVCYQTDVIYGRLMQPQEMREDCIHANIHVPIEALPGATLKEPSQAKPKRELHSPYVEGKTGDENENTSDENEKTCEENKKTYEVNEKKGLPILVFIHGGGFMSGSGDSDLHGPEYLVSKKVIVITFNYRINVFGFLSLNTMEIPGNQGLRDQVTLLRWVQRNARFFGGDPENVTLMGQSAGATSVHLLTLSEATQGLYQKAYLMSGTAISGFYSPSPLFAQTASQTFLGLLDINSTDTKYIHQQLIKMPVEKINEAHRKLLDLFGLTSFVPTVESAFPGITRVVDDYPEVLISKGRGKNVTLIIGFTNSECEVFRPRFEQIDIALRIVKNPILTVPVNIIYTTPPNNLQLIVKKVEKKYFNGTISTQSFIDYCTDSYYKYPALKLSELRSSPDAAEVFLYQFAYDNDHNVLKQALELMYEGAAHIEDLTYVFKTNSMLQTRNFLPSVVRNDHMKDWMTNILIDFMHCSKPVCKKESEWPAVTSQRLQFQDIVQPTYRYKDLTKELKDILKFFDNLK